MSKNRSSNRYHFAKFNQNIRTCSQVQSHTPANTCTYVEKSVNKLLYRNQINRKELQKFGNNNRIFLPLMYGK